jgi:hypothetical protein
VSIGGALASAAYGAMVAGARELLSAGSSGYVRGGLSQEDRAAAF